MWQAKVVPFTADLSQIYKSNFHSVKEVRSLGLKLLVLCQYKWFRILVTILTVGIFTSAFALSTYGKLLRKGECFIQHIRETKYDFLRSRQQGGFRYRSLFPLSADSFEHNGHPCIFEI